MDGPVFLLVGALGLSLVGLVVVERARRRAVHQRDTARASAERLHDNVWELEAAAAARDRAEAANEAKGRFLATVSHEIRTPLAGIIGAADLLAALPLDAEAASYVGAIRSSGASLGTLIDEILDFSRIEAGKLELADEPFDLVPLVESVIELLSPRAQGQGLALASLIDPIAPRKLRGDPARLRQILLNLAGNAIKFTAVGGVGLRVAAGDDGTLCFTVFDTGPGIAPERRHAIFEEFEQGDHSPTRTHGGAGLGLAISRALAHRMGGALTLDHSSSDGSAFTLALPANLAERSQVAAPSAAFASGRNILLLADAPFEAAYLGERLTAAGATIACVTDENSARAALTDTIDLAILDCRFGEDVVRSLAAAGHAGGVAQVVLLLSPFERRALSPAAWADFDGWLVKPVREASLRAALAPRIAASGGGGGDEHAHVAQLDGRTILVAEDDPVNALIATRLLERQGANVIRVADGAAAVDALAKNPAIDAALMDIRMPVLDGLAAARAIRAAEAERATPRKPLVALSANAFEEDKRIALAAGFDAFLVKPVSPAVLADTLARALMPHQREAA